jgi:hypothetical protein
MLENISDMTVQIERFDGLGDVSVHEFDDLRTIMTLKNWTEENAFRVGLTRLDHPAKAAWRNNRDKIRSLSELEKFLFDRFGVHEPFEKYTKVLSTMKQGRDTGRKFADRFQSVKTRLDSACPGRHYQGAVFRIFQERTAKGLSHRREA